MFSNIAKAPTDHFVMFRFCNAFLLIGTPAKYRERQFQSCTFVTSFVSPSEGRRLFRAVWTYNRRRKRRRMENLAYCGIVCNETAESVADV
jgi:hypothetical protein